MLSGKRWAPSVTIEARFICGVSLSGEFRRSLLHEGEHALREVLGLGPLLLELRLEVEQLGEAGVRPVVDGALDGGVGARWAGGQALRERRHRVVKLIVLDDVVDQTPLERPIGRDAI